MVRNGFGASTVETLGLNRFSFVKSVQGPNLDNEHPERYQNGAFINPPNAVVVMV